ncbi:protein of unknown function DUF1338 [Cynara cardunculus var. scolymus]|uniref:2-oxoadipate dioxygenase/decarboxylase n=1 Tax=Cynara cardunculus var. scolymus TaxID=59895 RepID=A0A103YAM4_CYNCS|nr:protein of unknown function DUF1338 [Cynara cardunculus var. scolymus]
MITIPSSSSSSSSSPIFGSSFSSSVNPPSSTFVSVKFLPPSTMNHSAKTLSKFSIVSASKSTHQSPSKVGDSFFRNVISSMEQVYLSKNPTAKSILELVRSTDVNQICYDHLAYRTFGVNDYGIDSVSKFFLDFGYTQQEELRFPQKKLKALWFSPPSVSAINGGSGSGVHGPLPRIFISELIVDQMSVQAQEIIRKYVELSGAGYKHAVVSSANIKNLNRFIEDNGFKLNSEGGVLKVSPDALLLQSSTVADSIPFEFSDGVKDSVPCSYIEFAERLVLPEYRYLPEDKIEEIHRRDGFEVGNADKIFESTSKDQVTRKGVA